MHIEYRDTHHKKLPPAIIYSSARKGILIQGVSLATSFKQATPNPTLSALREANKKGVCLYLLVLDPKLVGAPYATSAVDSIKETIDSVQTDIKNGALKNDTVEIRGLASWPHFTGIMIDGNVDGPTVGDLRGTISDTGTLLLRVQSTIPPEDAMAQHLAPVFQWQHIQPTDSMCAFIRGFRHYWQSGRPLLKNGIISL